MESHPTGPLNCGDLLGRPTIIISIRQLPLPHSSMRVIQPIQDLGNLTPTLQIGDDSSLEVVLPGGTRFLASRDLGNDSFAVGHLWLHDRRESRAIFRAVAPSRAGQLGASAIADGPVDSVRGFHD